MASRPTIRTRNTLTSNKIGRSTIPENYRGSAVRQISPALASQNTRTKVLATGRRRNSTQSQLQTGSRNNNTKPTLSLPKSVGVTKGSGINLLGGLKSGNYTLITDPIKTKNGNIISQSDTQTISYSSTVKDTAKNLLKNGNPLEKAAAGYYLYMDDPNKKGSAKYYENQLKKFGLDINSKSNTGNVVGDFSLDVVKGFVGAPAQTGRTLAAGGMGAVLLSKSDKQKQNEIVIGGAKSAVKSTVNTAVESPGLIVGGILAGAAGTKGIGAVSKSGKTVSRSSKTSSKTKSSVKKPSLEKAVKQTQRKQKIKKNLGKVKPKIVVTLPETKPSLEKAVKQTQRKQKIKKNLDKVKPKIVVTLPETKPSLEKAVKQTQRKQKIKKNLDKVKPKIVVTLPETKPSLEKAVKQTQRKQKIKKNLDKVKPKFVVTLPETKPSLEKAVKQTQRKQKIKKNLDKVTPKVIVSLPSMSTRKRTTTSNKGSGNGRTDTNTVKSSSGQVYLVKTKSQSAGAAVSRKPAIKDGTKTTVPQKVGYVSLSKVKTTEEKNVLTLKEAGAGKNVNLEKPLTTQTTKTENPTTTRQDAKTTRKTTTRTNTLTGAKTRVRLANASSSKASTKSSMRTDTKSKKKSNPQKKISAIPPKGIPAENKRKRRIPDIELPEKKERKKRAATRKRYGKRQIVNPIPWLWSTGVNSASFLPQKIPLIQMKDILQ